MTVQFSHCFSVIKQPRNICLLVPRNDILEPSLGSMNKSSGTEIAGQDLLIRGHLGGLNQALMYCSFIHSSRENPKRKISPRELRNPSLIDTVLALVLQCSMSWHCTPDRYLQLLEMSTLRKWVQPALGSQGLASSVQGIRAHYGAPFPSRMVCREKRDNKS